MLLNDANIAWRSPVVRLLVNGQPAAGVTEAEVVANNHYAADSFRVALALDATPNLPPAFWAGTSNLLIDLQFSLNGAGFVSMIQGAVDTVSLDPISRSLQLEGRDLTAALIETRTQETFSNRTASEIATLLAERHNLTPVIAQTTTTVGRYYQSEHDRITLDQFSHATTEWDLLVFLARQEGFDVYVQGTSLYFQPRSLLAQPPYLIRSNMLIGLQLARSLTLARDIEVTVKSWNSRQKSAFTQTARALAVPGSGNGGLSSGPPQRYVYVRPNLTPNQALRFAQGRLAELSLHERTIDLQMPGELTLSPRSTLTLSGTGTDFDQTYMIDVIERTLRWRDGFTQRIRAKNTSPRTQTTVPADTVGAVTG